MFRLDKVVGPECPRCGYNATEIGDAGRRGVTVWCRFYCENCGHEFNVTGEAKAPRQSGACRNCGSQNTYATSTQGRKQYRKCRDCGENFADGI